MSKQEIESALRALGVRVTHARRAVYESLEASSEPLSASEIAARLEGDEGKPDLVTVYRTLEMLERCDLIVRIDRLNEGWRYAIRARSHRHSITCSACGGTSPLDTCELGRMERSLEQSTGFTNVRHSLQFYGTCPKCQP